MWSGVEPVAAHVLTSVQHITWLRLCCNAALRYCMTSSWTTSNAAARSKLTYRLEAVTAGGRLRPVVQLLHPRLHCKQAAAAAAEAEAAAATGIIQRQSGLSTGAVRCTISHGSRPSCTGPTPATKHPCTPLVLPSDTCLNSGNTDPTPCDCSPEGALLVPGHQEPEVLWPPGPCRGRLPHPAPPPLLLRWRIPPAGWEGEGG